MDWNNINQHQSYKKVRAELEKRIKIDNYGWDERNWHLTDIIREPSQMGIICMHIIAGQLPTGKPGLGGPLPAPDGRGGFPFRLKVLTRQACQVANDGKYINGWSAGNQPKREQTPENTIFPLHTDPPEPGDVVKIKVGYLPGLTPQTRDAMIARGESPIKYNDKTVDEDGCIWCEYQEAHHLLKSAGKRIKFPEYRRPDRSLENAHKEGRGPEPRTITQWHFEEVAHDYKAEPKKEKKPDGKNSQDD